MTDLKFPLVPDRYHLHDVGRTRQGNGYWITPQLAPEKNGTRDFVVAYTFDTSGTLISADVADLGLRELGEDRRVPEAIIRMKKKVDAVSVEQIWVMPFSVSFYGHTFGLVVREPDKEDGFEEEPVVDALPGYTLMFYGPWDTCNYDT